MLGFPALRLSGPYLAITTHRFAEILRLVAMNWVDLTRGSLGLSASPCSPHHHRATSPCSSTLSAYYYFVVLAAVLFTLFLRAAGSSARSSG